MIPTIYRCEGCRMILSDDGDGCPDCKICTSKDCHNLVHDLSEHDLCASCELDGATEELRLRWMELPLDFAYTTQAEANVRIWEANLNAEKGGAR